MSDSTVLADIETWRERIMYGDLLRITVPVAKLRRVMESAEAYERIVAATSAEWTRRNSDEGQQVRTCAHCGGHYTGRQCFSCYPY